MRYGRLPTPASAPGDPLVVRRTGWGTLLVSTGTTSWPAIDGHGHPGQKAATTDSDHPVRDVGGVLEHFQTQRTLSRDVGAWS